MKIFGKYLLMSAIALGLWSCSDDAPEVNNPDDPVDELYMSVRIQLPTSGGSRSQTNGSNSSTGGVEVGQGFENTVKRVLIILADKDDSESANNTNNNFIAYKAIDGDDLTQTVKDVKAHGAFNKSVLLNYIREKGGTDQDTRGISVNVYAFCNYTDDQLEQIQKLTRGDAATKWINATYTIKEANAKYNWNGTNDPIWSKESFLMANDDIYDCELPTISHIQAGDYNVPEKAFNLTKNKTIKVQRSVARFDFRDGSPVYNSSKNAADACKYNFAATNTGEPTLSVQLTEMSLVNLSKSFYQLIRTSPNGQNTNFTLCGKDTPTQEDEADNMWVVDTDAELKNGINASAYSNFFFWSGGGAKESIGTSNYKWEPQKWDTYKISEILKGPAHNFEHWTGNTGVDKDKKIDGYHIWRYATENTIPSPAVNQKNGITTGVIFKGLLTATDNADEDLKQAMANHKSLYSYGGKMYGDWDAVKKCVEANIDTDLIAAYNKCTNGETDAVKNGFARYQFNNADNGYPMYYPYWNRHNDNGEKTIMGHMEFQVVRNNIYKLQVTDISGLGHPTIPGDDPDPFNPENPDEKEDVHFTVDVTIVDWVVRVNDITFP